MMSSFLRLCGFSFRLVADAILYSNYRAICYSVIILTLRYNMIGVGKISFGETQSFFARSSLYDADFLPRKNAVSQ